MYDIKKYKMKRHPVNRLRVRLRRLKRSLDKRFTSAAELSEVQKMAISIARRAIVYEKSILLMAPLSGDRYIQYDDIFIKLEYQRIMIINGTYTYDISIPVEELEKLVNKFNFNLEVTRKRWEGIIRQKTERSLNTIYTELLNK